MIDIQKTQDTRHIKIDKVGIKNLRYPLTLTHENKTLQHTTAHINIYVSLEKEHKGTHMSRFIEIINTHHQHLTIYNLLPILSETKQKLHANEAYLEITFPYFIQKPSPITKIEGLMDYTCEIRASLNEKKHLSSHLKVCVPIKTLCPCSKAISEQGAHNQRSHVTVNIHSQTPILIETIVTIVESCASSELYSVLKREDEKYVTERAYNNPFFVEDVVREVTLQLQQKKEILSFTVESENFESIHNHNAYAYIIKTTNT